MPPYVVDRLHLGAAYYPEHWPEDRWADDIRLMREAVGADMAIKASGGIRDADAAQAMIEAGADRIGASASVAIAREAEGGS